MSIGDVPVLGPVVSLFSGITDMIVRGVNSSEHNFKSDLMEVLVKKGGMDVQTAEKVQEVLDSGKDQGMGDRLRALIAMGVIPASAIRLINQIADQDGVPDTSLDRSKMYEPMSLEEATTHVDADHMRALGRGDILDELESQKAWMAQQQAGVSNYGFGMSY